MVLGVQQTEGGLSSRPFLLCLLRPPRRIRALSVCYVHMIMSVMPMPESRLKSIVEQTLLDSTCFLLESTIRGAHHSPVIDVVLDSDVGLTAQEIASVSREIRFALDTETQEPYTLNVSSPGADRPLVLPRQFRKHIGRKLSVSLGSDDGPREEVGRLGSADEDGIELEGIGHFTYSENSLSQGKPSLVSSRLAERSTSHAEHGPSFHHSRR